MSTKDAQQSTEDQLKSSHCRNQLAAQPQDKDETTDDDNAIDPQPPEKTHTEAGEDSNPGPSGVDESLVLPPFTGGKSRGKKVNNLAGGKPVKPR